ncbi:MAG: hypothetical protein MUP16_09580 [Sedimentisphaerales bacterium]|nr:hypothetical protein [Sedimentisphaerales bacterium]
MLDLSIAVYSYMNYWCLTHRRQLKKHAILECRLHVEIVGKTHEMPVWQTDVIPTEGTPLVDRSGGIYFGGRPLHSAKRPRSR